MLQKKYDLFSNMKEPLRCASWFISVWETEGKLVSRDRASRVLIQVLLIYTLCYIIQATYSTQQCSLGCYLFLWDRDSVLYIFVFSSSADI